MNKKDPRARTKLQEYFFVALVGLALAGGFVAVKYSDTIVTYAVAMFAEDSVGFEGDVKAEREVSTTKFPIFTPEPATSILTPVHPTTSMYTAEPYTPSVCSKTDIVPYGIDYVDASWLYVGEEEEVERSAGPSDGYSYTCTPSSFGIRVGEYTVPPINRLIYAGTKGNTTSSGQTTNPCLPFINVSAYAYTQCMMQNPQ